MIDSMVINEWRPDFRGVFFVGNVDRTRLCTWSIDACWLYTFVSILVIWLYLASGFQWGQFCIIAGDQYEAKLLHILYASNQVM